LTWVAVEQTYRIEEHVFAAWPVPPCRSGWAAKTCRLQPLEEKFMARVFAALKRFWARETAANLVEYGLLVTLIAMACLGTVTSIGLSIKALFHIPDF